MNIEDEQWFLDSSDPPQPMEVNEYLYKLKKLFVVIDAVVKSVIVSPDINAKKATDENLASNPQINTEDCKSKMGLSVQDSKDSTKSLKQPLPEPADEDYFDQPD